MKFIVNRRTYDLDDSIVVAEVKKSLGEYGKNPDDDWVETLYKKNYNGEYFAYGKGGKNTRFQMHKQKRTKLADE